MQIYFYFEENPSINDIYEARWILMKSTHIKKEIFIKRRE